MESVSRRHICTHLFIATPFTIVKMFAVQLLVVSDSFQPHRLQHIRIPCPSLFPGICTNSCPLSRLCHPTISSSVALFSCPQSFPASGSSPVSRLYASSGQSIGASGSAFIHPSNEYSGLISFRIDWLDFLAVQGTLNSFLQHHSLKASIFQHSAIFII